MCILDPRSVATHPFQLLKAILYRRFSILRVSQRQAVGNLARSHGTLLFPLINASCSYRRDIATGVLVAGNFCPLIVVQL
jgi:hypothetical protein